jgi:NADH-quinone oxidoreductase subunit H
MSRATTFVRGSWAQLLDRLSITERLVLLLIPPAVGGAVITILAVVLIGPAFVDFMAANLPLIRFVVAAVAILMLTVPTAFVIIYMELKVIARMNLRVGPNRIGPWGSGMSVVHGLKVLTKEDFAPSGADLTVFTMAPVVTFLASVMTLLVIPFAPGLFGQDFNIGLLFLFAMSGMTVLGLLMAGWASFNKYSLLGGLRSAAQMISFEIPLTLSVVGIVLLTNTMSLNHIVLAQSGSALDWFVFKQPLAFLIFFIAGTAEANRTPFDMSEADSEIVAGFATEYSGMRYGFFFFAEYVNVFIVSALIATLFFGGWTAPVDWAWPVSLDPLDAMGIGPAWIALGLGAMVIGADILAVGIRLVGGKTWSLPAAFGLGLLIAGAAVTGLVGAACFIAFDWFAGIVWFMAKTYVFVFVFVWLRGTLPRVRIDQLMGFAWKWLLPAALFNLFLTATAVILLNR